MYTETDGPELVCVWNKEICMGTTPQSFRTSEKRKQILKSQAARRGLKVSELIERYLALGLAIDDQSTADSVVKVTLSKNNGEDITFPLKYMLER